MRRLALLLTCFVPLALPATAAATDFYVKESGKQPVTVGPKNDVNCIVDYDLYYPKTATPEARVPAILATNGFGGSKDEFGGGDTPEQEHRKLGPQYAKRGYAFLSYSGLGFGGSTCEIYLDDRDYDGKAGSQLITLLAGKPFVQLDAPGDPRVGMIGGSYGGQIQFAIAGIDRRLDTIIPQITWNDLSYSLAPNNTDFTTGVSSATPGTEKYQWTSLFFAVGIAGARQPEDFLPNTPPRDQPTAPCPNFDDRACVGKAEMDAQGYPGDGTIAFARHASVGTFLDDIRIPTFLVQGQSDTLFNLQETIATFQGLRARGVPTKMLWRADGHSGTLLGSREDNKANPESAYASRAYLEWFDFYLRGIGDRPALDVSYWRNYADSGKDDAAPAVASAPTYPVAPSRRLLLSGAGDLVGDPAAVKAGSAPFAVPTTGPASYSETSGPAPSQPPPTDPPGTFAAFSTAPLTEAADLAGVPRVTVRLEAPTYAQTQQQTGGKLLLFAKLYDVDPKGNTTVLPMRLISPVRVKDVTKPVTIELPGIVHRFAAGHVIRFVLAATDNAYRNNTAPGPVSVVTSPEAPGTLDLPLTAGLRSANASTPTPGSEATSPAPTQSAGAGAPPAVAGSSAAVLPSAKRCLSRRAFSIRLKKPRRGDRLVSATIAINGKRVKTVRGSKLRVPIRLSGLPRGTYRVVVTAKTKRKKTMRSARTFRTCTAKR